MEDTHNPKEGKFPPTRWTLVQQAGQTDEAGSFEALSKLCDDYWYPLYAFVRSQGASPDDASDEVQGFFAVLIEKEFLDSADREKGKLRTFLINALKKYRAKQYRAKNAIKRGGGRVHLSIDQEWAEGRYEAEPVENLTPEQIFDRNWARLLLDTVKKRLEAEHTKKGKSEEFEILKPFLARNSPGTTYKDIGELLEINEGNVKVRIHRLRQRFRELLKAEVSQTLNSSAGSDVTNEVRELLAALG